MKIDVENQTLQEFVDERIRLNDLKEGIKVQYRENCMIVSWR